MDYPNNFNIPTFSAGKTIAFSRSVAVWVSIAFFSIIALCGFVVLGIYLKKNYPFLVSIDPFTQEWTVITYPNKTIKEKIPQYQVIQEKLVWDFVSNWFTISPDATLNEERWQSCSTEECNNPDNPEQFNPWNIKCALACKSDPEVFVEFTKKMKPLYQAYVQQAGYTWTVTQIIITNNKVTENGGTWQVYATVHSTFSGDFQILAFIDIDREVGLYPSTLGYYVKKFNSYRMING